VTLLDRIFNRPCAEYAGPDFNWLKPFLVGEAERGQIASTAAEMGISDGVFKVAVHRLRKRYPEALRTESSETVSKARPGARGDTLFVGGPCP
jgi:hypothetical protein